MWGLCCYFPQHELLNHSCNCTFTLVDPVDAADQDTCWCGKASSSEGPTTKKFKAFAKKAVHYKAPPEEIKEARKEEARSSTDVADREVLPDAAAPLTSSEKS